MITLDQIEAATVATRANPELAAKFAEAAAVLADYVEMDFSPTDSAEYRRSCRRSAEAAILERLAAGDTPDAVIRDRVAKDRCWVVSRLPALAALGATPTGRRPVYDCPRCEGGSIPHGGKCDRCGLAFARLFE